MLTSDQVRFYRDEGYLVVENLFDEAEIAELNRVTDMFVDWSRSVAASDKVFDVAPNHSPSRPAVRRIKNPTYRDEVYKRARRNETAARHRRVPHRPGRAFRSLQAELQARGW